MRERVIKAFVALHPNSDVTVKDRLRNCLRIEERDILLSRTKTASSISAQLKSLLNENPGITELVIAVESKLPFAKKPNFGLLGMLSQRLLLRYWTLDTKNPESVDKVLRKASLVRLSNPELFYNRIRTKK